MARAAEHKDWISRQTGGAPAGAPHRRVCAGFLTIAAFVWFASTQAPADAEEDPTRLGSVWRRGGVGGYTAGAMFLAKAHGVLINGDRHRFKDGEAVPPGSTAVRRDQYATSPTAMEFVSATFDLMQLIQALDHFLDALGYTRQLHEALLAVRDYVRQQ